MENISEQNKNNDELDNPFDEKSMNILLSLPARPQILQFLLKILNGLGVLLYFVGGIGIIAIAYNNFTQSGESFSYIKYLIPIIPFVIGFILKRITKFYLFETAPIGNHAGTMIQYFFKGDIEKCKKIAQKVLTYPQPEKITEAHLFIKVFATELIAEAHEIYSNKDTAKYFAEKAIEISNELKEMGTQTPFFLYLFANSYRMAEKKQEAIDIYTQYLQLRPKDNRTKKIIEELKQ